MHTVNDNATRTDSDLVQLLRETHHALGAPWVRSLGLDVVSAWPGNVSMSLETSPELVHGGGVMCGQAIMAGMDSALVLVMASLIASEGPIEPRFTTVSLNTVFERAVPSGSGTVTFDAWATKVGRTLVFGEVDCRRGDGSRAASASATYLRL